MTETPTAVSFNKQSGESDRRYLPRWEVSHRVLFRQDPKSAYEEGVTHDVSGFGLAFFSSSPVDPIQKLTLLLFLCEDIAVQVSANVLWQTAESHSCLLGVRFENINAQIQEMILQHAFESPKAIPRSTPA